MKLYTTLITLIATSLLLSACAGGAIEVDAYDYEIVPVEKANVMPTEEELILRKPRVAILPLELLRDQSDISSKLAKSLEPAIRSELESALNEGGNVTLLDRNLAQRLQGALAEYEKKKGETPAAFQQADYLLIGNVDLTAIDNEHKAEAKTSKGKILPGLCITEANVSGVLKVYDILNNTIEDIEEINGRKRNAKEAKACARIDEKVARQYYQQATQDAVEGSNRFLKKLFAPIGYISEKRSNGKDWIFKVRTLGDSMSRYKVVNLYRWEQSRDQLTEEKSKQLLSIGEARVTDQFGEDFIWIQIKDKSIANRIKIGHVVKPVTDSFSVFSLVPTVKL